MVLRKPYAILIKNFRFIHLLLSLFMIYLFYRTYHIFTFFTEYLNTIATTISPDITNSLTGILPIIIGVIIVILSSIIFGLMKFKDKPVKMYLYNIFIYIAFIVYYIISSNIIKTLETSLIDVRTLKIIHDFTAVALVLEAISLVIAIIRSTGFDIKSFNFKQDLEDLEIESKDNEEFEVNTEIDTNKLKRDFNKKVRHFRYAYFENRTLFRILFAIIFVALGGIIIYNKTNIYHSVQKSNVSFNTDYYSFKFIDSYYTNTNYRGNVIEEDGTLLVVRFKARTQFGERSLKKGNFHILINGKKYYQNVKYKDDLFDLGETFNNQTITTDFKTYILVFKISKTDMNQKTILKYYDANFKVVRIKLNPITSNKENIKTYNLNEEVTFDKSILDNSKLTINSFEIDKSFKLQYNYCVKENCIESYEYLKPSTDNNADYLLKLSGTFDLDENLDLKRINSLYKMLYYFGRITYTKDDKTLTMNIKIKQVKPKKASSNDTYIEITKEVAEAEHINIVLNIREKLYTIILK